MNNLQLPDMTLHMISYGPKETPWSLNRLLYRGGAGAKSHKVAAMISTGTLGTPILERFPLVHKLYEVIEGKASGGASRFTVESELSSLRSFFSWADDEEKPLTLKSMENVFIEWTDHLLHRQRVIGDLSHQSCFLQASQVARLLNEALDLRIGLLSKTRISKPPRKSVASSDKQNLEELFSFGHALKDIIDCISVESILGPLPVKIQFRTGQAFEEWGHLVPHNKLRSLQKEPSTRSGRRHKKRIIERDTTVDMDSWRSSRYPIVNLRIQAEMLTFIAQTGMNLAQAHQLKISQFRYQSYLDGYKVFRVYKGRRQGEVAFEIFSGYRPIFEQYLDWRKSFFPDDDNLLFPLINISAKSTRAANVPPRFEFIKGRLKKIGIPFFPASVIRKSRINWFLRRSGDPDMTAEMHAHTQKTLLQNYEQPSLQIAMMEISRFHSKTDPAIAAPGPGACIEAVPIAISGVSTEAPVPDCVSPAGCLFCEHHRDIDTDDHVWSLASYRHFRSIDLATYRKSARIIPSASIVATIDRLTAKLKAFKESSEVRALWVNEALSRIEEGDYHPKWDGFIQLIETSA